MELKTRRYCGKPPETVLVDDDFDLSGMTSIYKNHLGYVVVKINGTQDYLHRIVFGAASGEIIDHINRNKLDNRLANLRKCTTKENCRNSSISKNNQSGFNGVSYRNDRKKYRAYIMVDRKQLNLGYYQNIQDAMQARINAENVYFGEFAPSVSYYR